MGLIASIAQSLGERLGPEGLRNFFFLVQGGFALLFVGVIWRLKSGGVASDSGFSVREADRLRGARAKSSSPALEGPSKEFRRASTPGEDDLAQARIRRPLQLEGIRIDGSAHEILGVALGASEKEIQKAYRERMKQYHPDKIGRPGSREWQDAQKIAEAINRAKTELLKRIRPL